MNHKLAASLKPIQGQGGGVVVADEPCVLTVGDTRVSTHCRVTFRPHEFPSANLELPDLDVLSTLSRSDQQRIQVELVNSRFQIHDIKAENVTATTGKRGSNYPYQYRISQSDPIRIDRDESIDYVEALIYNLSRFSFGGNQSKGKKCMDLTLPEWKFEIAPLGPEFDSVRKALTTPWHRPTHLLSIRPAAGEARPEKVEQAIFMFREFLSFTWGRDIGIALAHGYNGSDLVFAHWGITKLSPRVLPVAKPANWFQPSHAEVLPSVLSGFWRRHVDPNWKDAVEWAVYWYLSANAVPQNSETSLLASQAGLESLCMTLIQREENLSTNKAVKGKYPDAHDRIRRALEILCVPTGVPRDLTELAALAKAESWDGPQALTKTRNSLVHPEKGYEAGLAFEASQLSLWYLELVLLKVFDFKERYSNRTVLSGWLGQTEPVPWAASAPSGLAKME